MVGRPRAGGPARQAAKVASLGQDRPNAPRAFADPPSLHVPVSDEKGENGTGPRAAKRPRRSRGACGTRRPVPLATPSRCPRPQTDAQRRTGRPQTASGPHETGRVLRPRSGLGEAEVPPAPQDPSRLHIQQRETSFTAPRCPPAADRRAASDRPPQALKRGVSPGLVSRRS